MGDRSWLEIPYADHPSVQDLCQRITAHLEGIALDFDRWDEEHVHGPGMYAAIVVGPAFDGYADVMGGNRWPSDAPLTPFEEPDGFHTALETSAYECDGALVIAVDGVVVPQFVRFRGNESNDGVVYADWMGARHMSALDVSTRPDVITTVTLSQESGRVTVFRDGSYETTPRERLGDPWRVRENGTS